VDYEEVHPLVVLLNICKWDVVWRSECVPFTYGVINFGRGGKFLGSVIFRKLTGRVRMQVSGFSAQTPTGHGIKVRIAYGMNRSAVDVVKGSREGGPEDLISSQGDDESFL
jgi:hypothetical protein